MRSFTSSSRTLIGLVLLATLGAAACSASGSPSAAGSGNGHSTTPSITSTTPAGPAASTALSPASGMTLVPMQTAQGGEFASPSGNITCEVDYNRNGVTAAYCQTGTPPQSVKMGASGSYTTCSGVQCLGNAGIGTPVLAYGTATGVGPFVCESATTGVTCTAHGRGFQISRSGITPAS